MRVFTNANPIDMDQLPAGKSAHAVAVVLLGDHALNGVNYTLKVDGVVLAPDASAPKSATVVEVVEHVVDVVPVEAPVVEVVEHVVDVVPVEAPVVDDAAASPLR